MANVRMAGDGGRMDYYHDQVDTDLEANGLDRKQIERLKLKVGITKLKEIAHLVYPDDVDDWIERTKGERVEVVQQMAKAGKPIRPTNPIEGFMVNVPADLKRKLISALEDCGWPRQVTKKGAKHNGPVDGALRELLRRAGFH